MATFKSNAGVYYLQKDGFFELTKNLLRVWTWTQVDEMPEDASPVDMHVEGFKACANGSYMRSEHLLRASPPIESWIDMTTNGGFTYADPTNDWVRDTHDTAKGFKKWVPATDGQKRYKRTIEAIEARALTQESEYRFCQGLPAL